MRFLYDINDEGLCRRQSAVRHFTGKMPNDNDRLFSFFALEHPRVITCANDLCYQTLGEDFAKLEMRGMSLTIFANSATGA